MTQSPSGLRGPLYALAGAIVLLTVAVLLRSDGVTVLPSASAQVEVPRAGGGGIYLMPGQLSGNQWGVYLMDIDRQSLMVYRWDAGGSQLELAAARDFSQDRHLGNHNTFPPPREIERIIELERQNQRVVP